MDVFKLRLKIGNNELEAEGTHEYIDKQRDWFMESIKAGSSSHDDPLEEQEHEEQATPPAPGNGQATATDQKPAFGLTDIQKIATENSDFITLTAIPHGDNEEQDAMMLLLLAHKLMKNVDSVPTLDILNGMKQSGLQVDRLDRISGRVPQYVISTGVKKGTKYRLTGPGFTKAKELATALIASLAA